MLSHSAVFKKLVQEYQILIEQIFDVVQKEFPSDSKEHLEKIFLDVILLYQGHWPDYQECQTGYHNLRHAIEVALVSARMAAGYNLVEKKKLTRQQFDALIIASLFHDSGYIKDKDDSEGKGGKYTFTHVNRSIEMASHYLHKEKYAPDLIELVKKIILITEITSPVELQGLATDKQEEDLAFMAGTSDLIAQMADVNYMEHIKLLFREFHEAYEFHGPQYLEENKIKQYKSAGEMISKTIQFYENFVLPRMELLGRKDKYLISFFGEGRNPYLENITANLSGKLMNREVQWRRLGDILQDFGVVSNKQIEDALAILKNFQKQNNHQAVKEIPFRKKFLSWLDGKNSHKNLGDILIEMKAVDPGLLRQGLIDQILPPTLMNKISQPELFFLLHCSIMLHNISKDHWVFEQVLVMANNLLNCEASSILLANPDSREMLIAVSTAIKKEFYLGRTIPQDKGLSGWVYLQDRPAIVDNIETDDRFDLEIDQRVNFEPHCILAVPLHANGKPIGVMEFFNKRDNGFNKNDIQIMTLLANVIAISLKTALRLQN